MGSSCYEIASHFFCEEYDITKIVDEKKRPELKIDFSHAFYLVL